MNINITQEEAIIKKARAIINKTMHKYNLVYKESYKYLYSEKIDFNNSFHRERYESLQNEFDEKNKIKPYDKTKYWEILRKRDKLLNEYWERFKTKNPELKDGRQLFHEKFWQLDVCRQLNNDLEKESEKQKKYYENAKIEHELKKELFVIDRIKKIYTVISYDEKHKIMYHELSNYDTTTKNWGKIYRQFESNLNEVNMWLNVKKSYNIRETLQRENRERSQKYVELNKNYLSYLSRGKEDLNEYQKAKLIALDLWVIDTLNQLNDLLIDELMYINQRKTIKKN